MSQISAIHNSLPIAATGNQKSSASAAENNGQTFARMISESLEQELVQQTLGLTTAGADSMGTASSTMGQSATGLQEMLLTAAASGQAGNTEIALLMLTMMMQQSQGGEASVMLGAMASMLGQMDRKAKAEARETVQDSMNEPDILSAMGQDLFSRSDAVATGAALLPAQAWKAATPAVTNSAGNRSPHALRTVIDQFAVESSERYQPYRNGGDTYCNIFVWDVTSALGCEIPHYIDKETGAPRSYPDVAGTWEMGANATADWLAGKGQSYGWREVSGEEAQQWANQGGAAVTAWKNPSGGSGHVQIVCPSQTGGYDPIRGVTVAQAGANNSSYTTLSATFPQSARSAVKYYIHD